MLSKFFGGKSIPAEIQHIPEDIGQPTSVIPSVSAPIRLGDGEVCCLALPGTWSRRQKGRRRYKGAGLSVRAAKGVWLRGGGGQSDPVLSVEKISDGRLLVTTERVVFHGNAKSTTVNLSDIADIQYGPDHFQVTIENKPTEIFNVDQKMFNHKKVRLLISRVWLVAREGGFDTLDAQPDAFDEGCEEQIEVLESEIDQLTGAIECLGVDSTKLSLRNTDSNWDSVKIPESEISEFKEILKQKGKWDYLLYEQAKELSKRPYLKQIPKNVLRTYQRLPEFSRAQTDPSENPKSSSIDFLDSVPLMNDAYAFAEK